MSKKIKKLPANRKLDPGIKLVLNDGNPEISTATIQIKWFFTKRITDQQPEQQPTYLVFFEQNEKQSSDSWRGRRYICKVSQGFQYIPMFSSGVHKITVIAFAGKDAHKAAKYFMDRERYGYYEKSINPTKIEQCELPYEHAVAATTVSCSIPDNGLFAPPPPAWKKKWVNKFFQHDAEDECQFKRRAWFFAYHIQVVLMLCWWILRYGIVGIGSFLYVTIGSFLAWFLGFQTKNIFWLIKKAWKLEGLHDRESGRDDTRSDWSVVRCIKYKEKYMKLSNNYYDSGTITVKATPIGIIGLFVIIVAAVLLVILIIDNFKQEQTFWDDIKNTLITISYIIMIVIGIIVTVVLAYKFFNSNFWKRHQAKVAVKKEEEAKVYQQWLVQNYSLKNRPKVTTPDNIPQPINKTDHLVQRFQLKKWAKKVKSCKPYSE